MNQENFDADVARNYDQRFVRLQAVKDALHLLLRNAMTELPEETRLLCVGAGTGAELLFLAAEFPHWTFTVVEPSEPMMSLCRSKATEAGIADRCHFHLGYLNSIGETQPHQAATSILVSHFLTDLEERTKYFNAIAANLEKGGVLVTADLCWGRAADPQLMRQWENLLIYAGMEASALDKYRADIEGRVSLLTEEQLEGVLTRSGFQRHCPYIRLLLIQGWIAWK